MKKHLVKEAAIATVIIMAITYIIDFFPLKFEFANPIKQEFQDFDIYDLCYSGNKDIALKNDTNIIIIQATGSRDSLANQLEKIRQVQPAVIGFDLLCSKIDTGNLAADISLIGEMDAPNIVPAYRLTAGDVSDSLVAPSIFPKDVLKTRGGYVNFVGTNFSVVRSFQPYARIENTAFASFAVRIVAQFAPARAAFLQNRANITEQVNYSGNSRKFLRFTSGQFDDYFRNDFSLRHHDKLRHKIVLLGYFTEGRLVLDDLRFSPLNVNPTGRSNPDMYGVIIHANIIDMILEKTYIKMMPLYFSYLLAAIMSFFMLYLIIWSHSRYKHPNHFVLVCIQATVILLILAAFIQVFDWFLIKVSLLPIIISVVLCVEMFELYKYIALKLKEKFGYQTVIN